MSIAVFVVAISVFLMVSISLWGLARPRTAIRAEPLGDIAIVAAHQDDCVIMAGECAIESLRSGHSVRVIYLTCGDAETTSQRSATRCKESAAAWAMAGLPESSLHYCNLPESDMKKPSRPSEFELNRARLRLQSLLGNLPLGAAVVIPADGEQHLDHRMARELALEAVIGSGRDDLRLFEAAEYNLYYSMLDCPKKTLRYLLSLLPVLRHVFPEPPTSPAAGFVGGGSAWQLRPEPERILKKKAMLRAFQSEDGDLLVRLFGRPDCLRPIHDAESARRATVSGYLHLGERYLGKSVVLLLFLASLLLAGSGAMLGCAVRVGHGALLIVALSGVFLLVAYAFVREHPLETRLLLLSFAFGFISAATPCHWT